MRVVNLKKEKYSHYIGRGSEYGNPFKIGKDGTREEVIKKFEDYVRKTPHLLAFIKMLSATDILGCFCKPQKCHGTIILKIYQELHGGTLKDDFTLE
jgi:hypothetical protein